MIARCCLVTVAGFPMPTPGHVERLRGGARPRSYRGTRPRCASGTLMSLRTAPAPLRAPDQPPSNTLNHDSPTRPTRKTPTTRQQAKPQQPPPPQFARHGAHVLNHRTSAATPTGPQRTPNTDTRRGAYILCRDIRVSELCEDGSPAGAKRIICTSHNKTVFHGERKNPADSEESAGFSVKCAPWDSNPEPID